MGIINTSEEGRKTVDVPQAAIDAFQDTFGYMQYFFPGSKTKITPDMPLGKYIGPLHDFRYGQVRENETSRQVLFCMHRSVPSYNAAKDIPLLERVLDVRKRMIALGFSVAAEDDCSHVLVKGYSNRYEKIVAGTKVATELEALKQEFRDWEDRNDTDS